MDTKPLHKIPSTSVSGLLDDHCTCSCGARSERRRSRCRKCRARVTWHHRHQRPARLDRRADARARRYARSTAAAPAVRLLGQFIPGVDSIDAGATPQGGEH
jgi:hypothetical protein